MQVLSANSSRFATLFTMAFSSSIAYLNCTRSPISSGFRDFTCSAAGNHPVPSNLNLPQQPLFHSAPSLSLSLLVVVRPVGYWIIGLLQSSSLSLFSIAQHVFLHKVHHVEVKYERRDRALKMSPLGGEIVRLSTSQSGSQQVCP